MNKRENMDGMAVRRMEVPNAVLLGQVKEGIRCVWHRSRI